MTVVFEACLHSHVPCLGGNHVQWIDDRRALPIQQGLANRLRYPHVGERVERDFRVAGGGLEEAVDCYIKLPLSVDARGMVSADADGDVEYFPRPFAKKYAPAPA